MQARIERQRVYDLRPELPKALIGLTMAVPSTVDDQLLHLVKIRCSQINGCAFCLHMHTAEARTHGEMQHRLDTLGAWQGTPWFSDKERAALALCESLTNLPNADVSDQVFAELQTQFSEQEIVDLTAAIIVINSWNRVVAVMHFIPKEETVAEISLICGYHDQSHFIREFRRTTTFTPMEYRKRQRRRICDGEMELVKQD